MCPGSVPCRVFQSLSSPQGPGSTDGMGKGMVSTSGSLKGASFGSIGNRFLRRSNGLGEGDPPCSRSILCGDGLPRSLSSTISCIQAGTMDGVSFVSPSEDAWGLGPGGFPATYPRNPPVSPTSSSACVPFLPPHPSSFFPPGNHVRTSTGGWGHPSRGTLPTFSTLPGVPLARRKRKGEMRREEGALWGEVRTNTSRTT